MGNGSETGLIPRTHKICHAFVLTHSKTPKKNDKNGGS